MKGMKLRKVFTLLCLVMLLSVLPMAAFATEGEETCHTFVESCMYQTCDTCGAVSSVVPHDFGEDSCMYRNCKYGCGTSGGTIVPHDFGEDSCMYRECKYGCKTSGGTIVAHKFGSNGLCVYNCKTNAGTPAVTLSATKFTYDGTAHKPAVTVTAGGAVISSNCYSVTYSNNKNAGTATVAVTATGEYAFGTVTKTFTIEPATLTVGPASYTINQNDAYPGLWLSYSGLVAGEKVTVSPAPSLSVYVESGLSMNDPIKPMGKHTIYWNNMDAATISNPNYKLVKVATGVLHVIPTRADFTISGVKTYASVDGYAVNLHKFSDAKVEKILEKPEKDGTISLKFKAEPYLNYINTVRIPVELVEEIAKAANDAKSDVKALEVTLPNGRAMKLDAKALDDLAKKAEGKFAAIIMVKSGDVKTAEVEPLTKAQKKDLGDRPAYVFAIASGKGMVEDLAGELTMKIPYKTRYKETEEGLKVSLIDEDGKRSACETSYDEDTDKVVWKGKGLAFYVIEHEEKK